MVKIEDFTLTSKNLGGGTRPRACPKVLSPMWPLIKAFPRIKVFPLIKALSHLQFFRVARL